MSSGSRSREAVSVAYESSSRGGGPYTTMARVGVNDGAVVLRRCLEIEGRRASETFHCLWLVTADEVSSISSDLVAQCLRMPKKKKIIKPPLMNGLTWPPLSSISRPFCRATRRYHFRVISAQDIFTATRWHTFHAAMYFPNVLFHTFSIKRYITVVLQFLYTFARNGYLRKVILLKGEFKNLKYM